MWYSKAAEQGEHQSELALSGWYLTGSDNVLGQNVVPYEVHGDRLVFRQQGPPGTALTYVRTPA